MCRLESGNITSCNCVIGGSYCAQSAALKQNAERDLQGYLGTALPRPNLIKKTESSDEAQLAKLITSFNKLDARGRATLLRMAECMPSTQVAG